MKISNRIATCFIHFTNLKAAKEWYRMVFPFEVASEGDDYLAFKMEETELILLQSHHEHITPLPYSVFLFETNDIDGVFRELTDKGIKTDGIQPFPDGMRGCHVFDPEGNLLLICTPPTN